MTVAIVFIPATLVGAPLAARCGMRLVCALAMTLCAGGLACLSLSDRDAPMPLFIAGLLLFWTGVGGFMTPATQGILRSLPAADQGVASAVNDIAREFGAALGIALFGSLYYAGYRSEIADLTKSVGSAELAESIHRSPGTGLADLAARGGSPDQILAVQDAVFAGWQFALWVGVGVLLGGMALICACLPKHVRAESDLPVMEGELPPVREPASVLT
jgi:hypothetical protein